MQQGEVVRKEGEPITVERSDWAEKIENPPADTVWPVLNLQVDNLYVFACVGVEDDPPNDYAWIVFVYENEGPKLRGKQLVRLQSKECFPEEEAISRASRAVEHLVAAIRLARGSGAGVEAMPP